MLNLFRFIDWVMRLPKELEEGFRQEVYQYEEKQRMQYITSIERMGILQTAREAVIDNLEVHFERVPPSLVEAIQRIDDPSFLKSLHRQAITLGSLEEFEQVLGEYA